MYLGWNYQGLAIQAHTDRTIEEHLFKALKRVKLVPDTAAPSEFRYTRCGRTDKGVSALQQVVAMELRSNGRADGPAVALEDEVDYPSVINRNLPPDIRVIAWAPAPDGFNARFSCLWREYRYFLTSATPLDTAAMTAAAQHFVGPHDFRNFCKMDVSAVTHFDRNILGVEIRPLMSVPADPGPTDFGNSAGAAAPPDSNTAGGCGGGEGSAGSMLDSAQPQSSCSSPVQAARAGGGCGHDAGHSTAASSEVPCACGGGRGCAIAPAALGRCEPACSCRAAAARSVAHVTLFTVRGTAFLWHQVRCMVAVLQMVGLGLEPPDIVQQLLDVEVRRAAARPAKRHPRKPVYSMAPDRPLILYRCGFSGLRWRRPARAHAANCQTLSDLLIQQVVSSAMLNSVFSFVEQLDAGDPLAEEDPNGAAGVHGEGEGSRYGTGRWKPTPHSHVPLLRRQLEASFEERLAKLPALDHRP